VVTPLRLSFIFTDAWYPPILSDRRHVHWDTSKPLVPADFRHPSKTGDFELDNLEIEDFLVTVHQPGGQRPFNVSIFNAQIGPFRKRWMFYDMLSAVGITGQYDNCLFSLHKPQKLGTSSIGEKDERIKRLVSGALVLDGFHIS
jgi:distribution and morphology protein 31